MCLMVQIKSFVFAFLVFLAGVQAQEIFKYFHCKKINWFRFKNGTVTKRKTEYRKVAGSARTLPILAAIYGMEMSTLTPFFVTGLVPRSSSAPPNDFRQNYFCTELGWGRLLLDAEGDMVFNGPDDAVKLAVECVSDNNEKFSLKTTLYKVNSPLYTAKEAGFRARCLIGQSIEKFRAHEVITYTGADRVYTSEGKNCWTEFSSSRVVSLPAPGIVILGKYYKHCAIFDHEGTKFVHSNPMKKVVTEESIIMLDRYFPNGYYYMEYAPVSPASTFA
eukprot:TRINITY_DN3336_c0_g1_i3.p1 TRINITY_DN3336_c0_g1~~TRINITY_DN3336_c0_g1_i3.p1  ORF type:complete len:276 (+),score=23.30 TRINITY_DN3336_c0_g1_i3:132-959(+)